MLQHNRIGVNLSSDIEEKCLKIKKEKQLGVKLYLSKVKERLMRGVMSILKEGSILPQTIIR